MAHSPREPTLDHRPEFMVTLGLAPPYVLEDVKQAYRDRARETHPDRGGSVAAFKEVQEAFERAQAYLEFRGDRRGWIAAKMGRYTALQESVERLRRLGAVVMAQAPSWLEQSFGDFAQLSETVTLIRRVGPADGDAFIRILVADHPVLRELEILELPKCQVTDDAVLSLGAFQHLKRIDLSHTTITGRSLALVDAVESIQSLDLEGTTVGWWAKRRAQAKLRRRAGKGRPSFLVGILMAMTLLSSPFVADASADEATAELVARVQQALPESPGACVLAIDDGKVVFRHGFGVADVESGEPCTPSTNFRMASVSKQFTATAVLLLVDRGQLGLDDTLEKFFPGFPKYGEKITVRHLLTHTSGLPEYENLIPEGTTLQLDDLDVVQMLMDTKEPLFAAGEKWQYSNSAFVVLGMIVEIAAHKPFHEFMADEIFRPLEMNGTLLYQRGLNKVNHRAFGHERKDGQWVRADQSVTSATRGDGVVYTSLDDYQKWLTAHCERKLLSEASHQAMFSPQEKSDREESYYGYGWFLDEYRKTRRIHHNGDSRGFRLCVQAFPERTAAVLLQFNGAFGEDMTKVGERLADLLVFDREPK